MTKLNINICIFFFRVINLLLTEHAENTQGTQKKEEK